MRRWLRVSLKIASLISVVNEPLIFSSAGGKIRKVYGHAAVWRSRRSRGCSRWQGKPRQVAHQEQGAAMLKSIAAIMAAAAIAAVLTLLSAPSARLEAGPLAKPPDVPMSGPRISLRRVFPATAVALGAALSVIWMACLVYQLVRFIILAI